MSLSAAITNAVWFKNKNSRIASSVVMVVSGRQRSRSSMRTMSVTPSSCSVSSKHLRIAWISLGGELGDPQPIDARQQLGRLADRRFPVLGFGFQGVGNDLQQRSPDVVVTLIEPGVEFHEDVFDVGPGLAIPPLQRPTNELNHGRLADAPRPGHTDGDRSAVGLDDDLRDGVRDAGKVQEVNGGFIVGPHGRSVLRWCIGLEYNSVVQLSAERTQVGFLRIRKAAPRTHAPTMAPAPRM
jgi:hypothetical protein